MNGIKNACLALLVALFGNTIFGYNWEFANHTTKIIDIKLFLAAGPSGRKIVMPDTQESIAWEVPDFYAGFCLQELQYRVMPEGLTMNQMQNSTKAWRAIQPTWVPNSGLDKILEAVSDIGSGAQSVAVAGTRMAAAAQTGGASELGAAAGGLDDEAAARILNAQAGKQQARADRTSGMADAAGNVDLGAFIRGIGKAVSVSTCRGRHFDIVEDENGILHFLTTEG